MERYKVLHDLRLGSGTFGTVTVGIDMTCGTNVAMKFISKRGKQDSEILGLKKECEIQKYLRHPNVIQMLDSFETERDIVVVTELAHGDLYKMNPQNSRWDPKVVKKIACDLVSALHFLHSQRILHRDLKPQNILIGIDGKAKLCDFGFAKMIAINSFMLTSMKGTPLYMSVEQILEQPYDQTADLWSLGCILYELFVGQPPFHTNSLFVLRKMMIENPIEWHDCIPGDALSFLQGLLEKDPKKRLNWPVLLDHPYVRGKLTIDWSIAEYALTKALSPSQELVKESERQQLQRELEQCSKAYRKAMKKYAHAQKKLKRWNSDAAIGRGKPPPFCDPNLVPLNIPHVLQKKPIMNLNPVQAHNVEAMLHNLKIREESTAVLPKSQSSPDKKKVDGSEKINMPSSPSDATTSSSDCETESDDDSDEDDRKTVVPDEIYQKKSTDSRKSGNFQRNSVEIIMGETLGRSGEGQVLFTLDTSGSTEFVTDTGEWMCFLAKNMKEALDNPETLCDKPFLTMVLAPLKSTSAESIVLEKIAVLLSLPFTLDENVHVTLPGLICDLQRVYTSTKVLPLLLFACKLIVVNRVNGLSLTLDNICEKLTEEDLNGLEKCFRLVTLLVHMDENFVTQFCDSVCVLKLSAIFKLFLRLDKVRCDLTVKTVSVLCHLLRIFPNNKSIVEEVILGAQKSRNDVVTTMSEDFYKLISHADPHIQSKSIRLFAYLFINSARFNREFVEKRKPTAWNILRKASISPDCQLRETAKLALRIVNGNKMSNGASKQSYTRVPESGSTDTCSMENSTNTHEAMGNQTNFQPAEQEQEINGNESTNVMSPLITEEIRAVVVASTGNQKSVREGDFAPGANNDASR